LGAGWCGPTKISSTLLEVSSNGVGASGSYLIDAGGKFLHLFLGHTGDELSAFSSDFAIVSGPIGRSVIGKLSKCTRKVCKLFLSIKHTSRLEDKICKHSSIMYQLYSSP
jgi:hypothetical protein